MKEVEEKVDQELELENVADALNNRRGQLSEFQDCSENEFIEVDGETSSKKRKRGLNSHHEKNYKRPKPVWTLLKNRIEDGSHGVLVTCAPHQEARAAKEFFKLFEPFLIESLPQISTTQNSPLLKSKSIAQELASELEDLRDESEHIVNGSVVKMYETGVKGMFFVRFLSDALDSVSLVHKVFLNAEREHSTFARCIIRLIPIHATCYAKVSDAVDSCKVLFETTLGEDHRKSSEYCIMYKSRNNTGTRREEFLQALQPLVPLHHSVNLKSADIAICVEICCKTCFIGVVHSYYRFSKLNLRVVVEKALTKTTKSEPNQQNISESVEK